MIRVGSWNILGRRNYRLGRTAEPGAITTALSGQPVDVLCLQEVHFFDGAPEQQVVDELRSAGLVHLVGASLSPSHLDSRACLGLVIASRYPLRRKRVHRLRNPRIRALVRGKKWVLHDKGLLGATLWFDDRNFLGIYTLHLFPFFEFGVNEPHHHVTEMWQEFWHYVDRQAAAVPLVLAGDFNQKGRFRSAQTWSRGTWRFCFHDLITTENGLALDDIAVNWPATVEHAAVSRTFSDHRLIVVGLDLPVPGRNVPDSLVSVDELQASACGGDVSAGRAVARRGPRRPTAAG